MWAIFVNHITKEKDKFVQIDFIADDMLDGMEPAESHGLVIPEETTSDYSDDSD